jgi:hypothetical protein
LQRESRHIAFLSRNLIDPFVHPNSHERIARQSTIARSTNFTSGMRFMTQTRLTGVLTLSTIKILQLALNDAWRRALDDGWSRHDESARDAIATCLIETADAGESDPERLTEAALRRLRSRN